LDQERVQSGMTRSNVYHEFGMRAALTTGIRLRRVVPEDVKAIDALIVQSIHVLHAADYEERVRNLAVELLYGVDDQLIRDGTYSRRSMASSRALAGGKDAQKGSPRRTRRYGKEDLTTPPSCVFRKARTTREEKGRISHEGARCSRRKNP
jgi:hypothetical protein